MARNYTREDVIADLSKKRHNVFTLCTAACITAVLAPVLPITTNISPSGLYFVTGILPALAIAIATVTIRQYYWIEGERIKESERRGGKPVLGLPPDRRAFEHAINDAKKRGKNMIDGYCVGFELDSGRPIWVKDDELCTHAAVFAKTGVGKTLWLESLMYQQLARGRASGFTFIDAKRDPGTLADIILMAMLTGRAEDVIVIDPFDPVCAYNFVFTTQRPDVKARKVLRCGLPPTSDQSVTKHYDRLASDAVYRVVRAMESLGLAWSIRDVAVALSAFNMAYPRLRSLLHDKGEKQALIEIGHLAGSYRGANGKIASNTITDNLRGIASELHSLCNAEAGQMFCVPRADLSLTDAILRGKIIYYMLPRLEEAESAARMVKVFREDLEVSIGEITSGRGLTLEDPHMVIIDEGASTLGPTWANLFELARKGRFALLFGAQSVGGLMDEQMGLSEQFYERVIANVNLKVVMQLGDNRTAEEMAEWIGKVNTMKQSLSSAVSSGVSAHELTKNIELNRRSSDSFREALTVAEDEEDLVSPEELKHEMSAEKGLAWFDKGDGILRKGRSLWFDADIPTTWEGREYLVRYEAIEADEIGLAEWVDEHILSLERADAERDAGEDHRPPPNGSAPNGSSPKSKQPAHQVTHASKGAEKEAIPKQQDPAPADEGGAFRINLMKGFRGMGRSRTFVGDADTPPEPEPDKAPEPQKFRLDEKKSGPKAAAKVIPAGGKKPSPKPRKNQNSGGLNFKGKGNDVVTR